MRSRVLSSFRHLRRIQKKVFAGDPEALAKFKEESRIQYLANRDVTDPEKIEDWLAHSADAADFINTKLVQVVQKEDGSRIMKIRPENTTKEPEV